MKVPMRGVAMLAATLLSTTGCVIGDIALDEHETVVETRALEPDGYFRLENTNGRIEVDTWKEPRVRIEAEKAAATRSGLEDIRVEISGEGERVEVDTRMPKHHWFMGRAGKVDYRITVPETARVELESVNGRVDVRGVNGSVHAGTVNGRVQIEDAGGEVRAETVNGSVDAEIRAVDSGADCSLSTTNGSITVRLPKDVSGRFHASTVNGGIHTDFPLDVSGGWGGKQLEGRIGEGGAHFEMETVNGSVSLREL